MSRLATFATDEDMKLKAKETVRTSVKQLGNLLAEDATFTTTSLNLLKQATHAASSNGLTGIHFEPQNYNIGQAIVLNVTVKVVGNETTEAP